MSQVSKVIPSLESLQRTDVLCLHLGELDPNELLVARAAVRFCYAKLVDSLERSPPLKEVLSQPLQAISARTRE